MKINAQSTPVLYLPGNTMHFTHAKFIARTPWGWRDGVVRSSGEGIHVIRYVEEDAEITVGSSILEEVEPGTPVRLHEEYYALAVGRRWFNVRLLSPGLGHVPVPEHPEEWLSEAVVPLVDLSDGIGLGVPLDSDGTDPDADAA